VLKDEAQRGGAVAWLDHFYDLALKAVNLRMCARQCA
jgi:hypothetical protein